ncbi:hypothetical protein Aperf_G00000087944 [Anoplocephala perfoliata]
MSHRMRQYLGNNPATPLQNATVTNVYGNATTSNLSPQSPISPFHINQQQNQFSPVQSQYQCNHGNLVNYNTLSDVNISHSGTRTYTYPVVDVRPSTSAQISHEESANYTNAPAEVNHVESQQPYGLLLQEEATRFPTQMESPVGASFECNVPNHYAIQPFDQRNYRYPTPGNSSSSVFGPIFQGVSTHNDNESISPPPFNEPQQHQQFYQRRLSLNRCPTAVDVPTEIPALFDDCSQETIGTNDYPLLQMDKENANNITDAEFKRRFKRQRATEREHKRSETIRKARDILKDEVQYLCPNHKLSDADTFHLAANLIRYFKKRLANEMIPYDAIEKALILTENLTPDTSQQVAQTLGVNSEELELIRQNRNAHQTVESPHLHS